VDYCCTILKGEYSTWVMIIYKTNPF
jgi:hypothetical protein